MPSAPPAALFGHNAPQRDFLGPDQRAAAMAEGRTLADEQKDTGRHHLFLDRSYPSIVPGGFVVLESPSAREVYQVLENTEVSRAEFGLSAKITRLALDRGDGFDRFTIRETTVHAESEAQTLAPLPIEDPVAGSAVTLDGAYLGLAAGRRVVVAGDLADLHGVRAHLQDPRGCRGQYLHPLRRRHDGCPPADRPGQRQGRVSPRQRRRGPGQGRPARSALEPPSGGARGAEPARCRGRSRSRGALGAAPPR